MSGLGEPVCPLTPRLKQVMDSLRSGLTHVGMEESSVASLSVSDYSIMDANWFTSNGSSIIERSERIAMKSAVSAFSAGEVRDASASFHSSVAFSGEPLDIKRQQQKKPKWDLAFEPAFDDGGSSGRARANVMHDEAAQALYDFMDAEAKERYMRGFDKLPGETGEKLILRTFRGWGPGTLKGAAANSTFLLRMS